jgi:hypothetical protein
MPRVAGLFVSPSGLMNEFMGAIVKAAANSQFAHAAVVFEDYMVETVLSQVYISPLDKYEGEPVLVVVEVPVTSEQYAAGVTTANRLVGLENYLIGSVTELQGNPLGTELAKYIESEGRLNDSAAYTIIFRAMFPEFLEGHPPSTITPQVAYEATVDLLNRKTL